MPAAAAVNSLFSDNADVFGGNFASFAQFEEESTGAVFDPFASDPVVVSALGNSKQAESVDDFDFSGFELGEEHLPEEETELVDVQTTNELGTEA
jgi:hypothetical protein